LPVAKELTIEDCIILGLLAVPTADWHDCKVGVVDCDEDCPGNMRLQFEQYNFTFTCLTQDEEH
jgi:hypothetical protein